jgi:eukaryotic-like serine/threonine-protein kinase
VDLLLEQGVLDAKTYQRGLRAWRDDPGAPLAWGDFEVMGELGRGLTGVVYAARLGSQACALKLLRALGPEASELSTSRFKREVELLRRLDHPAIVRLLDAGVEGETRYHATEFVDGGSLVHALRVMDPGRALGIATRVGEALCYAHDAGVIHRDLKPENVLLDRKGRPQLVDFGLAKDLDGKSVTHSDVFLGTVLYAAPEQVAGAKRVDARADVYGLAGVLRFLLTGKPPHQAQTMGQWFECLRRPACALEPSPGLGGRLLEDVNALLLRALSPAADDRHSSMAAFVEALRQAQKRVQ